MPLRLQATEDDVYHLMDLKEQYFIMTAICSVAEGISAYFFIYQKRCWDLVYLCTALTLAIILLLRQAIKISRRIMEAENCYMALEEDSLAVCQPEKNGKYESCRIFYDEMDKIVEGTRRGVPEFYIVIRKEGHAFGVCTSKTPGNDVWVTSYMKENRSEAEIRKSENDKEEMS